MDADRLEAPAAASVRLCHRISVVADALDVSSSSVRRLIQGGELETIKIGSSVRVTEASLQTLLQTGLRRTRRTGKKCAKTKR